MLKTIRVQREDGRFTRERLLLARGVWALHRTIEKTRRQHYTITHLPTRLALTTWITSRRLAEKTLRECAALPGDWWFTERPVKLTKPMRAAKRIASRFKEQVG